MGQAIAARIEEQADLELAGIWTRDTRLDEVVGEADVVIDFSLPQGTEQVLVAVRRFRKPLVCGVSGLDDTQMAALEKTAQDVPVLYDRNMSLGVAVLDRLLREAVAALGPGFDVAISETHHVHKKDAPSGTALKLGEAVAAARADIDASDIRYEVERRGEVPGDHEVVLRSSTEELRLAHSVTTRQVFADGALRAARWLVNRDTGLYSMGDVLFD